MPVLTTAGNCTFYSSSSCVFLRDGQKGGWKWLSLGSFDLSGSIQPLLDWGLLWHLPGSLRCALADTRVPQESPWAGNSSPKGRAGQGGQHSFHPQPGHPHTFPALATMGSGTRLLKKDGNLLLQMNFQEGRITKVQNNHFSTVCVCARTKPSLRAQ